MLQRHGHREDVKRRLTIGGEAVRLCGLRVWCVHRRLLHAAELGLSSVGRHGRSHRRGQDVGIRSDNQTDQDSQTYLYGSICYSEVRTCINKIDR